MSALFLRRLLRPGGDAVADSLFHHLNIE